MAEYPWMGKIGPALRSLLVNDAAVAAIVGTRVFPEGAAVNQPMPYVTYVAPLGDRQVYAHGVTGPAAQYVQIQVDWYSSAYQVAVQLGDAIFSALEGKDLAVEGWGTGRLFSIGGWPISWETESGETYWRGTRRYQLLLIASE